MEAAYEVPMPSTINPIEVEIAEGTQYEDALWHEAAQTIEAAEAELVRARRIRREAEVAFERAMAQREAVQIPRDQMIATDPRNPAQIGRLAMIGRSRCSQIRIAFKKRTGGTGGVA